MLIDFHRRMLTDRVRHDAFREALRRVIDPGATTVADIGAGSGILSLFARQLGASEVWLYEPGSVLALAEALAARNGVDHLHFVPHHSLEVAQPVPVDVVIAEVLGNFAYEEGVLETLRDARRFLKPGGTLIPHSIAQYAAPVVNDAFDRELRSWRRVGHGLDLTDAERTGLNNMYVYRIEPSDLLAQPDAAQRWDALEFGGEHALRREGRVGWTLASATTLYGFALWWDCTLAPGVALSTSPHAPRTHWDQIYLPLLAPLATEVGDRVDLTIACESGGGPPGISVEWSVTQERGGRAIESQKLDIGSGYVG